MRAGWSTDPRNEVLLRVIGNAWLIVDGRTASRGTRRARTILQPIRPMRPPSVYEAGQANLPTVEILEPRIEGKDPYATTSWSAETPPSCGCLIFCLHAGGGWVQLQPPLGEACRWRNRTADGESGPAAPSYEVRAARRPGRRADCGADGVLRHLLHGDHLQRAACALHRHGNRAVVLGAALMCGCGVYSTPIAAPSAIRRT